MGKEEAKSKEENKKSVIRDFEKNLRERARQLALKFPRV